MKDRRTDEQLTDDIVHAVARFSTSEGYGVCGLAQVANEVSAPKNRVCGLMRFAVRRAPDLYPGNRILLGGSPTSVVYRLTDVMNAEERETAIRRLAQANTKLGRVADEFDVARATPTQRFASNQLRRQHEAIGELIEIMESEAQ
jgi:hypothetical protein